MSAITRSAPPVCAFQREWQVGADLERMRLVCGNEGISGAMDQGSPYS